MGSETAGMGSGQVAFLLAQLGAHAADVFAERLKQADTTPPVAGLLRTVAREPGRSQQQLATELGMAPSRLVALVDRLENDGLIERRRHPTDRRLHALHLTETGEQRLRAIGKLAREHGEALLEPLTDTERQQLATGLAALARAHALTPGVHPGYRGL